MYQSKASVWWAVFHWVIQIPRILPFFFWMHHCLNAPVLHFLLTTKECIFQGNYMRLGLDICILFLFTSPLLQLSHKATPLLEGGREMSCSFVQGKQRKQFGDKLVVCHGDWLYVLSFFPHLEHRVDNSRFHLGKVSGLQFRISRQCAILLSRYESQEFVWKHVKVEMPIGNVSGGIE